MPCRFFPLIHISLIASGTIPNWKSGKEDVCRNDNWHMSKIHGGWWLCIPHTRRLESNSYVKPSSPRMTKHQQRIKVRVIYSSTYAQSTQCAALTSPSPAMQNKWRKSHTDFAVVLLEGTETIMCLDLHSEKCQEGTASHSEVSFPMLAVTHLQTQ